MSISESEEAELEIQALQAQGEDLFNQLNEYREKFRTIKKIWNERFPNSPDDDKLLEIEEILNNEK